MRRVNTYVQEGCLQSAAVHICLYKDEEVDAEVDVEERKKRGRQGGPGTQDEEDELLASDADEASASTVSSPTTMLPPIRRTTAMEWHEVQKDGVDVSVQTLCR